MKVLGWFLLCGGVTASAAGQGLPSTPVSLVDGRVVLGGEASVSMAPEDLGFFNYSDYEHSTLRELRLGMKAMVRATDRISVLGELRSENLAGVTPFALYARIRPFPERRLDIQVGRIPPTFGSQTRMAYGRDNPLIGSPLAYQYLTSLRPDAVPWSADELLEMRGRGWLTSFSVGNTAAERGVPLVSAFTWDTGVQVSTGWKAISVAAAVTNGTASNPRVSDDNRGKQFATRLVVEPAAGLVVGASFARGDFISRVVRTALGPQADRTFAQRVYGTDVEYSRDHWLVRGDAVLSEWDVPFGARPETPAELRAVAMSVEGRYTFLPGAYGAARIEHLAFNRIAGSTGRLAWEAPVTRLEVGGGYYIRRNVIGRVSVQFNERDAGRVRSSRLAAAQLLYWF
jgi:hypothetical protein